MSRNWWGKFVFLVLTCVLSIVYVYPTLSGLDPLKTKFPFKQKINLGLDLQGGLYLVLGVDFNKVFKEVVSRQGGSFVERLKDKSLVVKSSKILAEAENKEDPKWQIEFEPSLRDKIYDVLKKDYSVLRLTSEKPGQIEVGISTDYRNDIRDKTMSQSIEVIRNRIDEFGVAEPVIASQGTDRVVVELAGVKEIDRAKDLIGKTARLEFKIVNDKAMPTAQVMELIQKIEKDQSIAFKDGDKFSEYVRKINEAAKGKIPEGSEIAFERPNEMAAATGGNTVRLPYLLFSKAEVTGDDLQDASVGIDQENQRPNVNFTFNPKGAQAFDKLTGDHVHERLAIVLDNIVHSAPVIQTRIGGGRGVISLGQGSGEKLMKEAKDLAIVLRAGALPAQLEFLEQRVVGPSLGQDSINKGALASLVGCAAVFLFVIFYYRLSGMIAVFSLVLNVLFVLAILVGMEATLTLPGIAGIALTVGIAVDSNVVIYERIREEIRAGKKLHGAIEAGFQKAFKTILDANVTNAAAAIVLLMYGTGPIKGFAVTMLVGIVTTLFTAVFVCKLIFDVYLAYLENQNRQDISI